MISIERYVYWGVILALLAASAGVALQLRSERAAHEKTQTELQAENIRALRWQIDGLQARRDLATCQQQWSDAKISFELQLTEATTARVQAERNAASWKRRWDARSNDCDAALETLNTACPMLENY